MPPLVVPALGLTRVVIGTGLLVNPTGLGRALGAADPQQTAPMGRLLGAREIAIGLGTLVAWRRGQSTAFWVAAQAISDASDTLACAAAAMTGRVTRARGWGMAAFAASGAISEALTARALEKEERASALQ
jgi:hypothetical protein